MTITYQSLGTVGQSNATPFSATAPAVVNAGDLLVAFVGAHSSGVSIAAGSYGWIPLGNWGGGVGAMGVGTGPTRTYAFYKIADGAEDGIAQLFRKFNTVSGWVAWANVFRYSKTLAYWDVEATGGADISAGAAVSITGQRNIGITTNDHLIYAFTSPTNGTSGAGTYVCSATGATITAPTQIAYNESALSNDISSFVARTTCTAGTSSAVPVFGATMTGTTTNVAGGGAIVRIRETDTPPVTPSLRYHYDSAFAAGTTTTISSIFTVPGDTLVAWAMTENGTSGAISISSTMGIPWTLQKSFNGSLNEANISVWTATASGSGGNVTFTVPTSTYFGGGVYVFSESGGPGASVVAQATGIPSLNLTTQQADSAVVFVSADWNAVDTINRGWNVSSAGAVREAFSIYDSTAMGVYSSYYPAVGVAGSKTVGLTGPTGQVYSAIALEVKNVSSNTINVSTTAHTTADGFGIPGRTTLLSRNINAYSNTNQFGVLKPGVVVGVTAHTTVDGFGAPTRTTQRNIGTTAYGNINVFGVLSRSTRLGVTVTQPTHLFNLQPTNNPIDGATVTTSNSNASAVFGSQGLVEWDYNHTPSGNPAIQFTGGQFFDINQSVRGSTGPLAIGWARFYFKVRNPSGTMNLFNMHNGSDLEGDRQFSVVWNSGQARGYIGSTFVNLSAEPAQSVAIANDVWYRCEVGWDYTTDTITYKLYGENNILLGTAQYTSWIGSSTDRVIVRGGTNSGNIVYIDDLVVSNTGWIGPRTGGIKDADGYGLLTARTLTKPTAYADPDAIGLPTRTLRLPRSVTAHTTVDLFGLPTVSSPTINIAPTAFVDPSPIGTVSRSLRNIVYPTAFKSGGARPTIYDSTVSSVPNISHFWRDNTWTDVIGSNNGIINGSPTTIMAPDGSMATNFNPGTTGLNDWIQINNSGNGNTDFGVSASNGSAFTVMAWVRPDPDRYSATPSSGYYFTDTDGSSGSSYVNFLGKGTYSPSNSQDWTLRVSSADNIVGQENRISFHQFNPTASIGTSSHYQNLPTFSPSGEWKFIVAQSTRGVDGTTSWTRIFVNGSLIDEDQWGATLFSARTGVGNGPMTIGTRYDNAQTNGIGDSIFQGAVSKVAIVNRAISLSEVQNLYSVMTGPATYGNAFGTLTQTNTISRTISATPASNAFGVPFTPSNRLGARRLETAWNDAGDLGSSWFWSSGSAGSASINVVLRATTDVPHIYPTAYPDTEGIGVPSAGPSIRLTGYVDADSFGSIANSNRINLTAFSDPDAYGNLKTSSKVYLSGYIDSDLFGAFTKAGTVNFTAFADADAFGVHLLKYAIYPTAYLDVDGVGIPLTGSSVVRSLTATSSQNNFGSLSRNAVFNQSPVAHSDPDGIGSLGILKRIGVSLTAHTTADGFGLPTRVLIRNVQLTGYADYNAIGNPNVAAGPKTISITAYDDYDDFGAGLIRSVSYRNPTAHTTPDGIGTVTRSVGPVYVNPTGYTINDGFGSLRTDSSLLVSPYGFSDADGFGTPIPASGAIAVAIPAYQDDNYAGSVVTAYRQYFTGHTVPDAFGLFEVLTKTYRTFAAYSDPDAYGLLAQKTARYVSPTGFVDFNPFGALQAFSNARPTGFSNVNNFGNLTRTTARSVAPTGYSDLDIFGLLSRTTRLARTITAYSNSNLIGYLAPSYVVKPIAFSDIDTIGNAQSSLSIRPTAIPNANIFGVLARNPVSYRSLSALSDGDAFGSLRSANKVTPTGYVDIDSFGLFRAGLNIRPNGFISFNQFGNFSYEKKLTVQFTGKINPNYFGTILTTEAQLASPYGLASSNAFGLIARSLTRVVSASGYLDIDAFGSLNTAQSLRPIAYADADGYGIGITHILSSFTSITGFIDSDNFGGFSYITPLSLHVPAYENPNRYGELDRLPRKNVSLAGFSDADSIPTGLFTPGFSPTALGSDNKFGAPTRTLFVSFTALLNNNAFGQLNSQPNFYIFVTGHVDPSPFGLLDILITQKLTGFVDADGAGIPGITTIRVVSIPAFVNYNVFGENRPITARQSSFMQFFVIGF